MGAIGDRAKVSVVIVPREQFSMARRSLESVLLHTTAPHRLVYVDTGGPTRLRQWLRAKSAEHSFRLIEVEDLLSPNQVRNLALEIVDTEFIAFLDNNVVVRAGWLEALLHCAGETSAAIVGPATLIGGEDSSTIHLLGGDFLWDRDGPLPRLTEIHRHAHERFGCDPVHLQRRQCDLAEFHGMLVRRRVFETLGKLDESLRVTHEHADLCLAASRAGMTIWYEPGSVITYLTDPPPALEDAAFFRSRWDRELARADQEYFANKWRIDLSSSAVINSRAFVEQHREALSLPDPSRATAELVATRPAQTPPQLFRQLLAAGCCYDDLARSRRACDLATQIYSGLHRACGTPFLCHAVGTASILHTCGAPLNLVLAGLLHAAYTQGLFDSGPPGVTVLRRQQIERAAGASVERLVDRYARFDGTQPPPQHGDLGRVSCDEAAIHLMRIANDLDEHLDLAAAMTTKPVDPLRTWRPYFANLTRYLGIPRLGQAFDEAIAASETSALPGVLQRSDGTSFLIEEPGRAKVHPHRRAGDAGSRLPERVRDDVSILVHGHRRRHALHLVLEGLRRQNALENATVWLDGCGDRPDLIEKVEACQRLEAHFPQARWVRQDAHFGIARALVASLGEMLARHADTPHHKILVFEDDCFPAENAVATMCAELDARSSDDTIFSVYGHHFGDPRERDAADGSSTAFQCWGWGATVGKLQLVYGDLAALVNMTDEDRLAWIEERLTPEIRERMDVFPARSSTAQLPRETAWDAYLAFLVARLGMRHRATWEQVVFNFGIGTDSLNFSSPAEWLVEPPFNMVSEDELIRRFNLPPDPDDKRFRLELGKRYGFAAASSHLHVLGRGWSNPEAWGVWSDGSSSVLRFQMPRTPPGDLPVRVVLELNALSAGTPEFRDRVLRVEVTVSVKSLARRTLELAPTPVAQWVFPLADMNQGRRLTLELPPPVLEATNRAESNGGYPPLIELRLSYDGAMSPKQLGVSHDTRVLAVGLLALEIPHPAAAEDPGHPSTSGAKLP